jgi:hypothetical protein
MACDEAELGPEGLKQKMEDLKAEQQREYQKMKQDMQEHMTKVSPDQVYALCFLYLININPRCEQFLADVKSQFKDMTPAQLEGLHKLTAARQNQTEGLTDEQIMARAMNKIAVGMLLGFFFS